MTFNSNSNNNSGNSPASAGEKLLMVVRQHQLALEQGELSSSFSLAEQLFAYGSMISILVNPKNQGIIASLGIEMADELRQKVLATLVEYHHQQAGMSLPQLFAQACTLELEDELAGIATDGEMASPLDNPTKPRWTQARVRELVSSPLDTGEISRIRGRTFKEQVYLSNIAKAEEIVQLLGKYGQLTLYQLVALLLNQETRDSQAAPWTLHSRVREALQVLKLKELVGTNPISGWDKALNLHLWKLTQPGKIYYAMLNGVDSASLPDSQAGLLDHCFGINQILAMLAASCAMATRLGTLDRIVQEVVQANPATAQLASVLSEEEREEIVAGGLAAVNLVQLLSGVRTPLPGFKPVGLNASTSLKPRANGQTAPEVIYGCRLELAHSEPVIEVSQGKGRDERRNIRPDALGLLIYDTELVLPTVAKAAHLGKSTTASPNSKRLAQAQLHLTRNGSGIGQNFEGTGTGGGGSFGVSRKLAEEAEFVPSPNTGRQYWPFILEYDRGTESSTFFAEKVEAYSALYNGFKPGWPVQWGGKFPLILVVTEGGPSYLATLMTAIKRALIELKERKTATERLSGWWFTCTDWFELVYGQYLAPQELVKWERHIYPAEAANNARFNRLQPANTNTSGTKAKAKVKANKDVDKDKLPGKSSESREIAKLSLGPDPHIWLHLDTPVTIQQLPAVTKYLRLAAPDRAETRPPELFNYMRSFPIPHVFNELAEL